MKVSDLVRFSTAFFPGMGSWCRPNKRLGASSNRPRLCAEETRRRCRLSKSIKDREFNFWTDWAANGLWTRKVELWDWCVHCAVRAVSLTPIPVSTNLQKVKLRSQWLSIVTPGGTVGQWPFVIPLLTQVPKWRQSVWRTTRMSSGTARLPHLALQLCWP